MAKKIVDETLKFNIIVNGNAAKKEYGELERAQRKRIEANKDLEAQAKKMEKANKQESESYSNLKKEIEANNKVIKSNEKRMAELTNEIGINNLTMRELGKEARKLGGILGNLDPNSEEWTRYNEQLKAVKGRMANLREEMKPVEESMDNQLELVGALGAGFSQLFSALLSGDIKGAKAGFLAVETGIKGATKAAWAFIATPVGAALAAVVASVAAIKFWADYNEGLREANMLTQQITGLQGEQADKARRQAQVMEDVYGADFKETLSTANGIVREFGGTFEEALDTIEKGLQKGQIHNNEYFDSLKEYDTFFADAGFSADEFRRVIETGYDLGVYTDKLPDAIKEFDISIREQTTASSDALKNAFGAAFTDDLLKRVDEGRITSKQALQEIAAEADKNGISIQQNAQLTADLFRGAGEDAGGALKIFEAYNIALNEQERALTPLEEIVRDVADANKELAEAQDEALKSDNYVALSNDISLFWTKTKTAFFNGIKFLTDAFSSANQFMVRFFTQNVATVAAFPTVVRTAFIKVKDEVFDVVKTFGGLGDVIQNLMDFNFEGASDSFQKFKDNFTKEVDDVTDVGSQAIDKLLEIRKAAGDKVDAAFEQRRTAAAQETASGTNTPTETPTGGNGGGGGGNISPDDQAKIDSRKKMYELLDQMEAERAIQEQVKGIEKAQREEEEEVIRIEAKFQKLQEEAAGETELLARLEEEKLAQIQDVRDRYAEIRKDNEESQSKDLAKKQQEFIDASIKAEDELIEAKKNATNQGLSILRSFLGESSEIGKMLFAIQQGMAIADIITNTSKAISVAMANESLIPAFIPPGIPNPVKPASAASTAATIAAAKVTAATQIASIAAQTITGFENGLYPVKRKQDGKMFNASFGGAPTTQIVGAPTQFLAGEVKPEMIIDGDTFKKMDPAVTNYILGLAGKASTGYENGMYGQQSSGSSGLEVLAPLLSKLNQRLSEPFVTETYYGAEASLKQQEYDKKIRNARTNAKIKK